MKRISLILIGMFAVCLMVGNALASDEDYIIISSPETAELAAPWQGSIGKVWGNVPSRIVAYDSPEGAEWIKKLGIKFIPYIIFAKKIEENDKFFEFAKKGMIERKNGAYVIPEKMILNLGVMFFKRDHKDGRLDLFVMSQCPYGNNALAQMSNYIEKNPGAFNVTCHYVTTFREFGIDSLHGPEEIKEDINQLLIQNKYPDKFWKYMKERWSGKSFEDACVAQGISPAEVLNFKDEGIKLLEKDSILCKELGINSSPVFLWENQILTNSLDLVRQFLPEPGTAATRTNAASEAVRDAPASEVKAVVFYNPSCDQCKWLLEEYVPKMEKEFGAGIKFEYYDIGKPENFEKQLNMQKESGALGSGIPEVFVGTRSLIGRDEIEKKLKKVIEAVLDKKGVIARGEVPKQSP